MPGTPFIPGGPGGENLGPTAFQLFLLGEHYEATGVVLRWKKERARLGPQNGKRANRLEPVSWLTGIREAVAQRP